MTKLPEEDFLKKIVPEGQTPESAGVMPLDKINEMLKGMIPPFSKRGTHPKEFSILGVSSLKELEGIVKIAVLDIIPPGEKLLSRKRQHLLVGDVNNRVIAPIVVKSGQEIFTILCAQDRLALGGRVSIEVYRGSVKEGIAADKISQSLVERKLPDLQGIANLLEVRDLGYYWNNTGISGVNTPVQALFYLTDKPMSGQELKLAIKPEYGTEPDPKTGPVLHNTEPVIRTLTEVEQRLDEILELGNSSDKAEAYLNDVFSATALSMLLRSIKNRGMPY